MNLTVALISTVFPEPASWSRLGDVLTVASGLGATLGVLPEIPLNGWAPADPEARDEDAEAPGGPRHQAMAEAAARAGIGVVGGAIVRDPATGRRHNTALVFDASGALVASYRKVHLPEEDGFWETDHYQPGDALSPVVDGFGLRLGLQICSDIQRPEGAHLLGAMGAEVIVNPRATEATFFPRWRTVFVASAMTSATYVLSVNRPPDGGRIPLGGPSIAVAPTGEILTETDSPMAVVTLERRVIEEARKGYPGYLARRADLYAAGWAALPSTRLPHEGR
jgi:predicted amidohydrolase